MRKPVKAKAKSPHVSDHNGRLTSGGAKHSTGAKGRATPANCGKLGAKRGNPPGAPNQGKSSY